MHSETIVAKHAQQDAFGPFSDSAAASSGDPFNFPPSMTIGEDEPFEGFGDFGDFQSAGEDGEAHGEAGDMTPTADSWSFASISSTGSEEGASGSSVGGSGSGAGSGSIGSPPPQEQEKEKEGLKEKDPRTAS